MKVEKQKIKLPIKKFEFEGGCLKRKKHGVLFPSNVRGVISGPSASGKTNLILTLLLDKNGLRFENVYLFSKSVNQPKYAYLEKVLGRVKGIGFFKFENEVLTPQEVQPNSVCIFDDVITEKQGPIMDFFAMGRHKSLDTFYLGQTYSRIPKQLIRDNANLIVVFKQDDMNLRHIWSDAASADMQFSEFREICKKCWEESHGFLVIDKESPKTNGGYRMGFDRYIKI